MREVKAEGGWGVVCTEYCSIHPTSDDGGFAFATLWDDDDVKAQALDDRRPCIAHGALAGVELWHGGHHAVNRYSREAPLSPSGLPLHFVHPVQARRHGQGATSASFRRWQVTAAKRAQAAGFDIVYVYAGHGYLPFAVHRAPLQPAQRRVWRQPREPRPPAARDDRGHEGRDRRSLRGGACASPSTS